jgi:succinate dehydrogenase/fumarate reductase flavoprotein subunit
MKPARFHPAIPVSLLALASLLNVGCAPRPDADVIVIGAGIAGLSAAIQASDAGASVIVIEANSVGGGHAVKAGGFALVGTPLQQRLGYRDSADIAYQDLMAWGEDADPGWVRRYVAASRKEVHDWLEGFGVRFTFILETPQHSVPRFHFARGSALNAVVPLLREAQGRSNVRFEWNSEATALLSAAGVVHGVSVRNTRSGTDSELRGKAIIVATGGWQADLAQVRRSWPAGKPAPGKLFVGAGQFATGAALALGARVGAATARMDHQVIFSSGFPDPRDPTGTRALLAQNPAAIRVNADGRRFVNESGPSKVSDAAALSQPDGVHWLIYDKDGASAMRLRDAVWLGNKKSAAMLNGLPGARGSDSLAALASTAGLPADTLAETVSRYNRLLAAGNDEDFGRFSPGRPDRAARAIQTPPFFAVRLYPMTRKSMGGLAIDDRVRVLDGDGKPLTGLYAAGEAIGVAGINGSYGGEGTFLGPAVYTGRIAGREAALLAGFRATEQEPAEVAPVTLPAPITPSADPDYRARAVTVTPDALRALVAKRRPGYWHFEAAHGIALERGLNCLGCHSPEWPTATPVTLAQRQLQLMSCDRCH